MTLENILIAIFCCFLFALITVGLLVLIKYLIIYPLSCYYTKRGTNKLQWKAKESSVVINQFYLEWRILPSELPYIIRVYGYNEWEKFVQTEYLHFEDEKEFKDFVSNFKTRKDLREYYNKIDDKIIWYEP